LLAANEMTTSTVVVRTRGHRGTGGFAPALSASSSDWEMWLRLALRGDVAYLARPIARYRQHPGSISRAAVAGGQRLLAELRAVNLILRGERARIGQIERASRIAYGALAARALLHAGDAYTRGEPIAAIAAIRLSERLSVTEQARPLALAAIRGDDGECMRLTRAALASLSQTLDGTRFGARIRSISAGDPSWEAQLLRAGAAVSAATPPGSVIAAVAKWDPTLLQASSRAGCNFPDRALMPDGYPRDGADAVAHLRALRARDGITHLVVPAVSSWWLEHYPELAGLLGEPLRRDADCTIFTVPGA
jgi:hypothetical protein